MEAPPSTLRDATAVTEVRGNFFGGWLTASRFSAASAAALRRSSAGCFLPPSFLPGPSVSASMQPGLQNRSCGVSISHLLPTPSIVEGTFLLLPSDPGEGVKGWEWKESSSIYPGRVKGGGRERGEEPPPPSSPPPPLPTTSSSPASASSSSSPPQLAIHHYQSTTSFPPLALWKEPCFLLPSDPGEGVKGSEWKESSSSIYLGGVKGGGREGGEEPPPPPPPPSSSSYSLLLIISFRVFLLNSATIINPPPPSQGG